MVQYEGDRLNPSGVMIGQTWQFGKAIGSRIVTIMQCSSWNLNICFVLFSTSTVSSWKVSLMKALQMSVIHYGVVSLSVSSRTLVMVMPSMSSRLTHLFHNWFSQLVKVIYITRSTKANLFSKTIRLMIFACTVLEDMLYVYNILH